MKKQVKVLVTLMVDDRCTDYDVKEGVRNQLILLDEDDGLNFEDDVVYAVDVLRVEVV